MRKMIAMMIALITALGLFVVPASAEDERVLLDSDLTSQERCMTVVGFSLVDWASGRCGYTTKRNIYANSGGSEQYMIFDAGEEGYYTSAEFLVTLHGWYNWPIEQEVHLVNRIQVSDDGTTWTNAPGIQFVKDANQYTDGNAPHWNYTLSVALETPVRFVKLDFGGAQGVFVHHAKLTGDGPEQLPEPEPEPEPDPEPEPEPDPEPDPEPGIEADSYFTDTCNKPSLDANDYVTAQYTDMQSVNWELHWFADARKSYITSKFTDEEDIITYTLLDSSKDVVSVQMNYFEPTNASKPAGVSGSRNGVIWSNEMSMQKTSSEQLEDTAAWQWRKVSYEVDVPHGMKQIRIHLPTNYRMIDVTLGFKDSEYAYDHIRLENEASGNYANGKWTVNGKLISGTEEITTVSAILGVYKDDEMLSLTETTVDLSDGDFTISSEAVPEDAEVVLYFWSTRADMISVIPPQLVQ